MRYMRVPGLPNGSATKRSAVMACLFRYPCARPSPAMYSSPATPGGTGCRPPSSTRTRVLAIGRPMTTSSPTFARVE